MLTPPAPLPDGACDLVEHWEGDAFLGWTFRIRGGLFRLPGHGYIRPDGSTEAIRRMTPTDAVNFLRGPAGLPAALA